MKFSGYIYLGRFINIKDEEKCICDLVFDRRERERERERAYDEYVNIKSEMRSFKSNENIHKKEGGSYYVVSANKASSVTL